MPGDQPAAQVAALVAGRLLEHGPDGDPERLDGLADAVVLEQALLELERPLLGLGVRLQVLREVQQRVVDRDPHPVPRVGPDVPGPAQGLGVGALSDALVEPRRRPRGRPVAHQGGDDVLVVVAARCAARRRQGRRAGGAPAPPRRARAAAPPGAPTAGPASGRSTTCSSTATTRSSFRIVQHAAGRARDLLADPLRVRGVGQPGAHAAPHADGGDPAADDVRRQEVRRDEVLQGAAEGVLAGRDQRGVRDRQPERVPEQGGDGEPVGRRADRRRLARGVDEPEPARAVEREQVAVRGQRPAAPSPPTSSGAGRAGARRPRR